MKLKIKFNTVISIIAFLIPLIIIGANEQSGFITNIQTASYIVGIIVGIFIGITYKSKED